MIFNHFSFHTPGSYFLFSIFNISRVLEITRSPPEHGQLTAIDKKMTVMFHEKYLTRLANSIPRFSSRNNHYLISVFIHSDEGLSLERSGIIRTFGSLPVPFRFAL